MQPIYMPDAYKGKGYSIHAHQIVYDDELDSQMLMPVEFEKAGRNVFLLYYTSDGGENWRPLEKLPGLKSECLQTAGWAVSLDGKTLYRLSVSAFKDNSSWETDKPNIALTGLTQLSPAGLHAGGPGWALKDGAIYRTEDRRKTWKMP